MSKNRIFGRKHSYVTEKTKGIVTVVKYQYVKTYECIYQYDVNNNMNKHWILGHLPIL